MKFSLRSLLIASILIGSGLGLYLMELEKRKPLILKVDYHVQMVMEVDRPATLTEFRSRVNVREVEVASEPSHKIDVLTKVKKDFSWFNSTASGAKEFVKKHPEVMRDAAKSGLEHKEFATAISAAWTLDQLGDKSGYEKLQERFLENRETDQFRYCKAIRTFRREGVELSDETIARVREIADSDTDSNLNSRSYSDAHLASEAAYLLCRMKIDDQPLLRHLKNGKINDSKIAWLLCNQPTAKIRSAANECLLAHSKFLSEYRGLASESLVTTILELGQSDPDFKAIAGTVELKIGESLHKWDEDDKDFFLPLLRKHGTSLSIPFLESTISKFDINHFDADLIDLLHDLGETKSAKKHLLRLFELSEFKKWNGTYWAKSLLRICPPILGPEMTVELCLKHSSPMGMSDFIEATQAPNAHAQFGCDRETLAAAREKAFEFLVDHEPQYDITKFVKHWYQVGLSRQKAVDWINEKLKPATSLTVARVLNHERYPLGEGIWQTWETKNHHVDNIYTFLLMGLAHSGHGTLASWDYTFPSDITGIMEEYASTESKEFLVSFYDSDHGYPPTHSIVVNDRVYRFTFDEGGNGADDRYDVGVIADLINTISIRQRLERRLFIYESTEGYCLVLYIKPEMARELHSVFAIYPDRGTDYYLEH